MTLLTQLLRCPGCQGELGPKARCQACDLVPEHTAGLLDFLGDGRRPVPHPEVNRFYEARPFPGYGSGDDASTLIDRCRASPFLAGLDAAIPTDATVLDAGCGTGQLAAFLALSGSRRTVVGADACRASLDLAREFKGRASIENLQLLRGDLRSLPLAEGAFDVVNCRGVVHHNADWKGATRQVARHVAPGGVLVLGFYESIARMPHRLRRGFGRAFKAPVRWLDPILRRGDIEEEKKLTWIADQYHHPLEWCLPFPAVVELLGECGFDWVRSIPPAPGNENMFDTLPEPAGPGLFARRVGWALSLGDEDAGLVCYVARRRR